MKITRAYAEEYAKEKGYEAIQIDGIPEGFSYTLPDITIGGIEHKGGFIAFVPLGDMLRSDRKTIVQAMTKENLLEQYKASYGQK